MLNNHANVLLFETTGQIGILFNVRRQIMSYQGTPLNLKEVDSVGDSNAESVYISRRFIEAPILFSRISIFS
jgi:hypothetical protein